MAATRLLRTDAAGRVHVYAKAATSLDQAESVIGRFGGEVERSDAGAGIVQAQVPINRLGAERPVLPPPAAPRSGESWAS